GERWEIPGDNLPAHLEAWPLVRDPSDPETLYAGFALIPYPELWRLAAERTSALARVGPMGVAGGLAFLVLVGLAGAAALRGLRQDRIQRLPKGSENFEPLGLAVDRDGSAWYTDGPSRLISRMSPDGVVASFALSTPVAKLARMAAAPDGAVWFAEESAYSFTRLKDGAFTRHAVSTPGIAPFGVAVDPSGAVWGT